jgi:hypothetical protein
MQQIVPEIYNRYEENAFVNRALYNNVPSGEEKKVTA